MNKPTSRRQLVLTRHTLRHLDRGQMKAVAGGAAPSLSGCAGCDTTRAASALSCSTCDCTDYCG